MVGFHGFPTLIMPTAFSARRAAKMSVISFLIVQNSKIILNLCRPRIADYAKDGGPGAV